MDLSFGRLRAQPATPVRLDYPRLIAILAAAQGATRTARIAGRLRRGDSVPAGQSGGLIALFDPQGDWIAAAATMEGRFNAEAADRLG